MTNSQVRHQEIRSRASPRSPMTLELSQTSENPTACTSRPVPTIESWDAGTGLETKRDCGTIYHTIQSILTLRRTCKKALIHEFEENQGSMVFSSMPLNVDMKMIRSSNFQDKCFCALRLPESFEEIPMTQVLGEYSTRTQLVLHRFRKNCSETVCCLNFHQLSFPNLRHFC